MDCIFANLYVTPEREQVIEFSEPTYIVDIGVLVHDKNAKTGGLLNSLTWIVNKIEINIVPGRRN